MQSAGFARQCQRGLSMVVPALGQEVVAFSLNDRLDDRWLPDCNILVRRNRP